MFSRLWPKGLVVATVGLATTPQYISSTYRESLQGPQQRRKCFSGKSSTDVVVIGGGLAGVNTAIGLAERGVDVILLEQKTVASGASGVNGGFVERGFQVEIDELAERMGLERANELYRMSEQADQLMRRRISENEIDCELEDCGTVWLSLLNNDPAERIDEINSLNANHGTNFEYWTADKVQSIFPSPKLTDAIFDPSGFSVNPLKLTLGLADLAEKKGAQVFEHSKVISVTKKAPTKSTTAAIDNANDTNNANNSSLALTPVRWVVTEESPTGEIGTIETKHVVYAGSAYNSESDVFPSIDHSMVSTHIYIGVTEPILDPAMDAWFNGKQMAFDDRELFNYFRPLPGRRILWGGGFLQTHTVPEVEAKKLLEAEFAEIFPKHAGTKMETVWGGAISLARHFMPLVGADSDESGLWHVTGFGGHGNATTTLAGDLIASAIAEDDQRWRLFADEFKPVYLGWPFQNVGAAVVLWLLDMHDKITITINKYF